MGTFSLRFQVLEWILAFITLFFFIKPDRVRGFVQERTLSWICFSFFAIGFLAKFLQYFTLQLHGQDFWLFVDLMEHTKRGEFFITHFAPQAFGPTQHGAVHPFIPWALLTPLAAIFSSVGIALIFGPLVLSLSAYFLDRISKALNLSVSHRLCILLAYLFSKQTTLTLMYEVHPEALYPLLSFGLIYSLMKSRFWSALASGILLGLLKEDSFMVIWGCLIALFVVRPDRLRKDRLKIFFVFALSLVAFVVQLKLISYFSHSSSTAAVPKSGPLVSGHTLSGLSSIVETGLALLQQNGGVLGSLRSFFGFLISDSWRGVMMNSPWLALSPLFWVSEFPLVFSFSLRGEQAVLWNYYSMPFMSVFWLFAVSFLKNKSNRWALAMLFLSLVNGSEGIRLSFPDAELLAFREEAETYRTELRDLPLRGVVASNLLSFVPLNQVISDHLPQNSTEQEQVDFYFLPKRIDQYGLSSTQVQTTVDALLQSGKFIKKRETSNLILLVRNPRY